MDSQDINCESKELIHLVQLAATVNTVINLRFLLKDRETAEEKLEYELLKKKIVTRNLAACRTDRLAACKGRK
jgi:hypothetical protein